MSISTKGGDKGKTSLWSGERVAKNNARVEAYGTIDELNSHLGEAKHYVKVQKVKEIIERIQHDLFRVGGSLATVGVFSKAIEKYHVDHITNMVYELERDLEFKGFVVLGMTVQSAKLDIARAVTRRAERRILSLADEAEIGEEIKEYVNRLSDLIYLLARIEEKAEGKLKLEEWR
ncbi:cob(I)yrinic acid a,c-diamide adenosyltransferase [Psychrilyobacter sp.]|uniref:cob(I)yrinic acid a,c-diamide adenosyltransferase n=1 Tax=Psychrilyobacter sp. TaxID=2586924 RepID=UPI003018D8FF